MKYNNKFNARKIEVNNIQFDSVKEAHRYQELKKLEKEGIISNLELQKEYELIPTQYEYIERYGKNGKRLKDKKVCIEKKCSYFADFTYIDSNGNTVVEDVKGYRDTKSSAYAKYTIKRKLMLYIHHIIIREI